MAADDLLTPDIIRALEAGGHTDLANRVAAQAKRRTERREAKAAKLSLVEVAIAGAVNGPDGKTVVPMSLLTDMTARDLADLKQADAGLHRRTLESVLSSAREVYYS